MEGILLLWGLSPYFKRGSNHGKNPKGLQASGLLPLSLNSLVQNQTESDGVIISKKQLNFITS